MAITDVGPPTFWLYARVHRTAKLKDVDSLIRVTWVECCGHMSEFSAGDRQNTKEMGANAVEVLAESGALDYEYDFGTSTDLIVRPVGACSAAGMKRTAEVVARNSDPGFGCGTCGAKGALAAWICPECMWGDQSPLLCKKCARKHEHEGEPADTSTYLPVVNSPRMGMCAYTG